MSEVENLMLEHLNRFQAGQDRLGRKLDELLRRSYNLEGGQASSIQHIGHLAAADAQQQVSANGFNLRLRASGAGWISHKSLTFHSPGLMSGVPFDGQVSLNQRIPI